MYYKVIRITAFRIRNVSFTQEPERETGKWVKGVFGDRWLVLQATEEEFKAYCRNKIPGNKPMRVYETYAWTLDHRPNVRIEYKPNRHQRKRYPSQLVAVAKRMANLPSVDCQVHLD